MHSHINSNIFRSILKLLYITGYCLAIILISGCKSVGHRSDSDPDARLGTISDSLQQLYTTIVVADDVHDWIYDGYHHARPREWKVVCEVNDLMQKTSHSPTDSVMLVVNDKINDYIKACGITFPKDTRGYIIALDSLVTNMFCYEPEDYYTPEYPYGNMDDMIATENSNIWTRYLNWYFLQNASHYADIEWRTEYGMFATLMTSVAAFYSDELTGNEGSGGCVLRAQVECLTIMSFYNMWRGLLLGEYERCDSQVPEECWENVFAELNQLTFCDEKRHPELVDSLRDKIRQWSEFRSNTLSTIGEERVAEIYRSQTAHVLRDIFIHARCHFDDLGLKSPSEEITYEWDTPDSVLYNLNE